MQLKASIKPEGIIFFLGGLYTLDLYIKLEGLIGSLRWIISPLKTIAHDNFIRMHLITKKQLQGMHVLSKHSRAHPPTLGQISAILADRRQPSKGKKRKKKMG